MAPKMALLFKIILSVYITEQCVSDFIKSINNSKAQVTNPLILYGNDVKIEDYPFYAGLINCGAAILSNTWILTAAHCVENIDKWQKNYVWVGGETFANSIRVPYNYIHIHQEYTSIGLPLNDIALIKLSHPLQFSKKIQPIKLPSGPTTISNITFVGRGIDETEKVSKTLKKVDLIKLSTVECIKLIPSKHHIYIQFNMNKLKNTNICAKREDNGPSICYGDSGSPLMSGDIVVGLASFIGNQGCKNAKLGFFVNVNSYVPWIKSITGL